MSITKEIHVKAIEEWEKRYIHALVDELKPTGDVLLVGFGNGEAAALIHAAHPKSLTIIESDLDLSNKATLWASKHPNTKVLHGEWKKELHHLGQFDSVFFDHRTNTSNLELIQRLSPELASHLSTSSEDLFAQIKKSFAAIKKKFTDEEMDKFFEELGQHHLSDLVPFLKNLRENGNITKDQFDAFMKKTHEKRALNHKQGNGHQEDPSDHEPLIEEEEDSLLLFVESAFKKHLHKGSRLTAFLSTTSSKYEDPLFFDRIATNSALSYHEKIVKIHVPDIKVEDALVILIQKS